MKVLGYEINFKKLDVSAKAESSPNIGKQNPAIISIAKNFKDSSRKDIQKWRKADAFLNKKISLWCCQCGCGITYFLWWWNVG